MERDGQKNYEGSDVFRSCKIFCDTCKKDAGCSSFIQAQLGSAVALNRRWVELVKSALKVPQNMPYPKLSVQICYLSPALALNPHSPQSAAGCLWLKQLHQKLNGIMTEPLFFSFFFKPWTALASHPAA